MGLIFAGRQSAAELIEFSEYLLRMSSVYMMSHRAGENAGYPEPATEEDANAPFARADRRPGALPGPLLGPGSANLLPVDGVNTLVERVFGVYACYSFFYLQPTDYITQIRITPSQMRDLMDFTEERLRPERHLDTLACLYKLVNDGAFRIVAFENCYDPSAHKRFEAEDTEEMTLPVNVDRPLGGLKDLFDDVTMKQLDVLSARYEQTKEKAGVSHITTGKINIRETALRLLETTQSLITNDDHGNGESSRSSKDGTKGAAVARNEPGSHPHTESTSRLDIKHKAYRSGVKASRNRRYAFADGEQVFAQPGCSRDGAEEGEGDVDKSKKLKKQKTKRLSRQTINDQKAEDMAQELRDLGLQNIVVHKSPRKHRPSVSAAADEGGETSDGSSLIPAKKGRKKRSELIPPGVDATIIKLTKSKAEAAADRELEKLLKITGAK